MGRYGLVITDIDLLVNEHDERPFPENLAKVVIKLADESTEAEVVEAVKPVVIDTNEPLLPKKKRHKSRKLYSFFQKNGGWMRTRLKFI